MVARWMTDLNGCRVEYQHEPLLRQFVKGVRSWYRVPQGTCKWNQNKIGSLQTLEMQEIMMIRSRLRVSCIPPTTERMPVHEIVAPGVS